MHRSASSASARCSRHLRGAHPAGPGVLVGVGDDAAAVETGPLTLVTTDCLVEGVHFRREWAPPRLLGRKALSVNLSDIAAMAGRAALRDGQPVPAAGPAAGFVDGLYDGLLERAAETGVEHRRRQPLGDRGPIVIDVTLLGHGDRLLRRAGAQPGDLVVVTGAPRARPPPACACSARARASDAEGELAGHRASGPTRRAAALLHCLRAQLDPGAAARLRARAGRAASGPRGHGPLGRPLGRPARAVPGERRGRRARLAAAAASTRSRPGSSGRKAATASPSALHGGEDYQLLLAVPPASLDGAEGRWPWSGTCRSTVVGEFTAGRAGRLR